MFPSKRKPMVGVRNGNNYFHISEWLPSYSFERNFKYDLISGITVGMMAIPQSISYATIAGLPAQYGLYSDLQVMYPIFGTSKYLVVSSSFLSPFISQPPPYLRLDL